MNKEEEKEKDRIFNEKAKHVEDFHFGKKVANVFDDMVSRSVPFYSEIQRMIGEMAQDFITEGANVYDLGCSTGTTLIGLDKTADPKTKFIGLDESEEMLKKCRENFESAGFTRPYELLQTDLNQGVMLENPSVVIMCLTLQFIRPLYREKLVQQIYNQLNPMGCLILVEKVLGEDSLFNRLFIKYYYEMKRRHQYSEMEISQKREALENILIPYKLLENRELLMRCGFRYVDTFFKWYKTFPE